jgi:hypothetical protein
MSRVLGWFRSGERPVLHGFQITWSSLTLADGSGHKGATVVVWVTAVNAEDARSSALRRAEEGLSGVVRTPIAAAPEIDDLGQRRTPVEQPQTGPGLWRTGYVFFSTETLH